MSMKFTASYEGTEHTMSIPDWHRFLFDKPITEHISTNTMRVRFGRMDKTGHSTRQCLGIDTVVSKCSPSKNGASMVRKSEEPLYLFTNEILRRGLI